MVNIKKIIMNIIPFELLEKEKLIHKFKLHLEFNIPVFTYEPMTNTTRHLKRKISTSRFSNKFVIITQYGLVFLILDFRDISGIDMYKLTCNYKISFPIYIKIMSFNKTTKKNDLLQLFIYFVSISKFIFML